MWCSGPTKGWGHLQGSPERYKVPLDFVAYIWGHLVSAKSCALLFILFYFIQRVGLWIGVVSGRLGEDGERALDHEW